MAGHTLCNAINKFTLLSVTDVPKYLLMHGHYYEWKDGAAIAGSMVESSEEFMLRKFCELGHLFHEGSYYLLIIGCYAISIIVQQDMIFVFDPHSRNRGGLPDPNGKSVLLTFPCFEYFNYFVSRLAESLGAEMFELVPITVQIRHFSSGSQLPPSSVNSTLLQNTSKLQPSSQHTSTTKLQRSSQQNTNTSKSHTSSQKYFQSSSQHPSNVNAYTTKLQPSSHISKNTNIKSEKCAMHRSVKKEVFETSDVTGGNVNVNGMVPTESKRKLKANKSVKRKSESIVYIEDSPKKRKGNKQMENRNTQDKKNAAKKSRSRKSSANIPQDLTFNIIPTDDPMKIFVVNRTRSTSQIPRSTQLNHGKCLDESIQKFNQITNDGPIYICCVCNQTNFVDNVSKVQNIRQYKNSQLLEECNVHYKSLDGLEYICTACRTYISKGKVPKLSIKNGCGFCVKPEELYLYPLEERYISPVMAFMLIHQLSSGGQYKIKGSICHIPIEINQIINTLPREFHENETIAVKLKRRLCYKNSVFHENIRPHAIIKALKYLLANSTLYKEHNIRMNDNWIEKFNDSAQIDSEEEGEEVNGENRERQDETHEDIGSEQRNAPSVNTLLTDANVDPDASTLCIAPGEGQKPIFTDADTEYLCFPSIYGGERCSKNLHHKLNRTEIFKYELKSADLRVSTNIPNLFWKTKCKQVSQISQKVNFALRRKQTKGKNITATMLLQHKDEIAKLNDGYRIFKTIRNSPPYFECKRKELMAMIRQLGIPTIFFSLSAADTRWTNLLLSISQIWNHNNDPLQKKYPCTLEGIDDLSWQDKCEIISRNPVMCARFFNNRVKKFIKHIIKSPYSPFGQLENFFYRVEFQHRGSPHIHGLLWIRNGIKHDETNDGDVCSYIDSIISCEHSKEVHKQQYIDLQVHKHSKSCIKKVNQKKKCRFGAPWPPMKETRILYPLDDYHTQNMKHHQENYSKINGAIQELYKKKEYLTFEKLLEHVDLTHNEYVLAVRSNLKKKKIFLKRCMNEIFTNSYMKHFVHMWKANHDIQYVLDPYSCVVYICDYLIKSNKGMSELLERAAKEAREGNMDVKQSVRHIGNKFLNCTEISEQECAFDLLELPITQSSVKVEFISTCSPDERVFIAKSEDILKSMDPQSQDIKQAGNIDRYASRPKKLEDLCLADFVSMIDMHYIYKQQDSDGNSSVDESEDSDNELAEEQNEISDDALYIKLKSILLIKIGRSKQMKLRRKRKVLRFVNYKYQTDAENYCREKLMLYIPWRNELEDLFFNTESFVEAYNLLKEKIHCKMRIYEPAAEVIDEAQVEFHSNPHDYIVNNEIVGDHGDSNPEIKNVTNIFDILNPNLLQDEIVPDISGDLNIPTNKFLDSVQQTANVIETKDYYNLVDSLNTKQYQFYVYIMNKALSSSHQECICLHGGAGTGKSTVIKAIYQGLHRLLNKDPGDNPTVLKTILVAPTGKAAHNIKGSTIHSAFYIPANQNIKDYKKLSWDNLNTFRSKYHKLKYIIFDEISMVGNATLRYVHLRLQEMKGNLLPFGGVNIIAVGDFFQLKPVKSSLVFEDYNDHYGSLACNLWKEHFKIYELSEIMRQKEDKLFAELLNRL